MTSTNARGPKPDPLEQLRSLKLERGETGEPEETPRRVRGPVKLAIATVGVTVLVGGGAALGAFMTSRIGNDAPVAATVQESSETAALPPPPSRGLAASGYVVARRQATISADVTARIVETLVEEGASVEAGQVLARLDTTNAEFQLSQVAARAQAASGRETALNVDLADARLALSRTMRLAERALVAEARVSTDQARVASLEAQSQSAAGEARAARLMVGQQRDIVGRHVVRAPFAGVIVGKYAQQGEIVSPTSAGGGFTRTGIYTLVDMSSLEVEVDVSESQIERVRQGQRVEAVLEAYPQWTIPAHVVAIVPTANRDRASIRVRVALDESDPRLLPEMAAHVTFIEEDSPP